MAYDAKAVANYFLDLAASNNTSITPMKLQKLIYFAHGWHLAFFGEPLIADQMEAWQFGPVVPSIYHEFKHERSGAISSKATEFDVKEFAFVEPKVRDDDSRSKQLMNQVWTSYGGMTAMALSNLTHLPDTPWERARRGFDSATRGIPISDAEVKAYFDQQLELNRAQRQAVGS